MSTFFADTSAVANRYVAEIGSSWVLSWIEPQARNVIVISDTTPIEIFSLLARRQRDKTPSPARAIQLQNDFLLHVELEYLSAPINDIVLVQARQLVTKHPLRALDALQLASALHAVAILNEPMTFGSSDKNLLTVAAAEGFGVDDPNAHP